MYLYVYVASHPDVDPRDDDDQYHWFTSVDAIEEFIEANKHSLRYFVIGATREPYETSASHNSTVTEYYMCARLPVVVRGDRKEFLSWLQEAPDKILDPEPEFIPVQGDPREIAKVEMYVSHQGAGRWLVIDPQTLNTDQPPYGDSERSFVTSRAFVSSEHIATGLLPGTVLSNEGVPYILREDDTLIGPDGTVYPWDKWPRPLVISLRPR